MATTQDANKPFRFTDLSPELRNSVYEYYFEDNAERQLDVFAISEHLPQAAITATSHEIRKETVVYYEELVRDFFVTHKFHIDVPYPGDSRSTPCKAFLDFFALIATLPPYPLAHLDVRLPDSKENSRYHFEFDAGGKLAIRFWIEGASRFEGEGTEHEIIHDRMRACVEEGRAHHSRKHPYVGSTVYSVSRAAAMQFYGVVVEMD